MSDLICYLLQCSKVREVTISITSVENLFEFENQISFNNASNIGNVEILKIFSLEISHRLDFLMEN